MDSALTGYSGRRRQNERPIEIIDAAVELFAARGFAATRLEDVAEAAGVSTAEIYLYFDSKEDLFFALVREIAVGQVARTAQLAESHDGSSADLLRGLVVTVGRMMIRTQLGAVLKLIVAEARNFPEVADFYRDEVAARGLGTITRVIERGIERGEFRPCDARTVAAVTVFPALMSGIWMYSLGPHELIDAEQVLETHMDLMLRGLAPGAG